MGAFLQVFGRSWKLLTALGVTLILGSVLFTNCGRATLGNLSTASTTSNDATSIQVGPASCGANEVAIGINSNSLPICVPIESTALTTCPSGSSVYQTTTTGFSCVDNGGWNQPGSVCPVGQYLVSYTSGSIQCTSPATTSTGGTGGTSGGTYSCPAGDYLNGIVNGQAQCVPLPVSLPTAYVCPSGEYLNNLSGSTINCQAMPWGESTVAACPKGSFAVGWLGTQLLCQQNVFPTSTTTFSCPAGQILLSFAAGQGVCSLPPDPDISQACPVNYNVQSVGSGIQCQAAGSGGGPQCPAGQFITGLNNGAPVCTQIMANNGLPSACGAGGYPIGVSNGAVVCVAFANVTTPTVPPVCIAGSQVLCSVVGGVGAETCNSSGTSLSACAPLFCASGFTLTSGSCSQDACTPGTQQSCTIANGTGDQYCGAIGTWGQCQVQACAANFTMVSGQCLPQTCQPGATSTCSSGPAYGLRACQADGLSYGTCIYTSCQNGFALQGQTCVDVTPPQVSFSVVPSNPTQGNAASLSFAAIDTLSGVQSSTCQLDGAAFVPCTSPVQLTNLSNGSHTFTVTAVDNAGLSSTAKATWSDAVCTAGSTLACTVANGSGLASCQANGTYSTTCVASTCNTGYDLTGGSCVALNCGPGYTVSGNTCVDQTPPTLTVTSAPANPTIGTTANVQFTAVDAAGIGAVTCQLDAQAAASCVSPLSLSGLAFGSHTLVIKAVDNAGNASTQTVTWTENVCNSGAALACGVTNGTGQEVCSANGSGYGSCVPSACNTGYTASGGQCLDQTPPTLQITQAPANPNVGTSASVAFSAADTGSGLASVMCQLDSSAAVACQSPFTASSLAPGAHTLVITALDKAGNKAVQTASWTNDLCAPNANLACSIPNGQGQQTCAADGSKWGACQAVTCQTAFTLTNGVCAQILHIDDGPKGCEDFGVNLSCPSGSTIAILSSSYGLSCGVAQNYGMSIVQGLCNGKASCSFVAGNSNNCGDSGVFTDPDVGCQKSYDMTYYCK